MPRTKGAPKAVEIMRNREAREEARASRVAPEPRSPKSAAEAKKRLLEEKRTWVHAQLTPLPPDNVDDFPFGWSDMTKNPLAYHGSVKEDDEEIIAEYDMYINVPSKKVLIFQYPNREPGQQYCDANGQKPLELRIKPKCGLVEIDIPMDIHNNFNKEKGVIYGEAMRKSRVLQEGGSYGMAGGFGIGSKPRPTASGNQTSTSGEPTHESLLANFEDANNKGHVMNKITLGGQIIPFKPGNDPNYYIGVFKGKNVYLNKVDAIVQLRPQFAHLDALADLERPARAQRAAENAEEEPEAKPVNMSVKSTEAEETEMASGVSEISKLLQAMREEKWQRMPWIDQDDPRAYDAYDEQLTIAPGKKVPDLVSTMTEKEWLDAMSAPRIDPTNPGPRHMSMPGDIEPTDSEDTEDSNDEDTDEDGSEWETDWESNEEEEGAYSEDELSTGEKS